MLALELWEALLNLKRAQIVINLVDFGMNLQEAGDAPRIVHSGSSQPTDEVMLDGGSISLEKGFGEAIEKQLKGLGHTIKYDKGCLLYTSPSPRDATLSRMPSSA